MPARVGLAGGSIDEAHVRRTDDLAVARLPAPAPALSTIEVELPAIMTSGARPGPAIPAEPGRVGLAVVQVLVALGRLADQLGASVTRPPPLTAAVSIEGPAIPAAEHGHSSFGQPSSPQMNTITLP